MSHPPGTEVEPAPSFEGFVAAHGPALLRTAFLLTGDVELARDLVQSTWEQVWPQWSRVAGVEFPFAYVRTALVRGFLASRRRFWHRETPAAALPEFADADPADSATLRAVVARSLAALTARQRAVLVLRFFADLDVEATAAAFGCSGGTVKSQTAKALARLRDDRRLLALMEDL